VNAVPPDNPQRMLVDAFARLCLEPVPETGFKITTIVTYGDYGVRLLVMPSADAGPPLWIELYDERAQRVIDSAGCSTLDETAAAVAIMVGEAMYAAGIGQSGRLPG
jgi:hypothetical protein